MMSRLACIDSDDDDGLLVAFMGVGILVPSLEFLLRGDIF